MHGEYKVPGGKLVVVDLDVVDGLMRDVSVSGDFFLDPDEALEALSAALDGIPFDASVSVLTETVTEALRWFPVPVTMVGFDARAVATAVRRALGYSTVWSDHTFELIHPGPLPPALHAALDQVLTEDSPPGDGGPPCGSGVGRAGRDHRVVPVAAQRGWISPLRPSTASPWSGGSPAGERCSWRRATASPSRWWCPPLCSTA